MSDSANVIKAISKFRSRGWAPGASMAIALSCGVTEGSKKVFITPECLLKENLTASDLFLLRNLYGSQDIQQPVNLDGEIPLISKYSLLFLDLLEKYPEAKAVVKVTTKWASLSARLSISTWRKTAENAPNVLRIAHWTLLDKLCLGRELFIPIISDGTPEYMREELRTAVSLYPNTCVVFVRDCGMISWGASLLDVESKLEIIEHLCELQVQQQSLIPL